MRYSTNEDFRCIDAGVYGVHCGREECEPGHSFGPYMRDHYLIHYIEKGKGRFEINDKSYNLSEGQIFFIMPKIITYYEADVKEPWVYKWIGIRARGLDGIFRKAGLCAENPVMRVNKNVASAIDNLLKESKKDNVSPIKFTACAYDFLDALLKDSEYEMPHKTNGQLYVENAVEYIWKYMYKKITVSDLAAYVNVDRSYLTSVFKQYTGLAPQQYIMEMKMKTACEYLETTGYDITQIARSVGYEDLFVFSHAFKSFMGVSPKIYRERIIKRHG